MNWKAGFLLLAVAPLLIVAMPGSAGSQRRAPKTGYLDWTAYGGSPENIRYSGLDQINRENVHQLQVAWPFDSGDAFPGSELQCQPIAVNGLLFATTPKLRVIALDAASGRLRWSFDPHEGRNAISRTRIRGLKYWESGQDQRIYFAALHYLYALDARTGKPAGSFGNKGRVDLREGLGRDPQLLTISINTPGVVYKDLLIVGSVVSEVLPAAPGDRYGVLPKGTEWGVDQLMTERGGSYGHNRTPSSTPENTALLFRNQGVRGSSPLVGSILLNYLAAAIIPAFAIASRIGETAEGRRNSAAR